MKKYIKPVLLTGLGLLLSIGGYKAYEQDYQLVGTSLISAEERAAIGQFGQYAFMQGAMAGQMSCQKSSLKNGQI